MVFEVRTEGFYIRHLNIYVFYYISYFYFQSDHFIIGTDIFRELRNEEKIQNINIASARIKNCILGITTNVKVE